MLDTTFLALPIIVNDLRNASLRLVFLKKYANATPLSAFVSWPDRPLLCDHGDTVPCYKLLVSV